MKNIIKLIFANFLFILALYISTFLTHLIFYREIKFNIFKYNDGVEYLALFMAIAIVFIIKEIVFGRDSWKMKKKGKTIIVFLWVALSLYISIVFTLLIYHGELKYNILEYKGGIDYLIIFLIAFFSFIIWETVFSKESSRTKKDDNNQLTKV